MASVDDVAAAVIAVGGAMDTFKLQKLVYYCQAWHLVWEDRPLFDDPIEAWAAGPVVRSLYAQHRGRYSVDAWPSGDRERLDADERETVDVVVGAYGQLSGRRLSLLTHRERPWQEARAGLDATARSTTPISLVTMKAYYAALDADESAEPVTSLTDE